MDVAFLITSHGRQESCQRLVDSLQGLGDIVVAIDGDNYSICGATNLNPKIHLGKSGYWRLINMLYKNRPICKMYLMLPDDFAISESQIIKAIDTWNKIDDSKKICLSIAQGRPNNTCWTGFKSQEKEHAWLSQWVDGCFVCENKFFNALGVITDLHRGNMVRGSSGVGAYISRHLKRMGYNMYQVKEELATPTEAHLTSQMHR